VKSTVAEKIRLERLRLNLSQQNMADELGITVAAYSNLERGVSEISVNRLTIIAGILKRSPQWFFDSSESSGSVSDNVDNYLTTNSLSNQMYLLIQDVKTLRDRLEVLETKCGGKS
jgi:transcriptional regulator with XRE-family HTH domain